MFPDEVGDFSDLEAPEMMYYLYYPIKDINDFHLSIPHNLEWLKPMIRAVLRNSKNWLDRYVYVTCKHYYVEPGSYGNRPGWHGDGFGTDDVNYVWCNISPTEFCIQDFDIHDDDEISLREFAEQAKEENVVAVKPGVMYRIEPDHIHRVALNKEGGFRSFVKISVSKHKYNLKGNSVNPDISKDWKFYTRDEMRNMESK